MVACGPPLAFRPPTSSSRGCNAAAIVWADPRDGGGVAHREVSMSIMPVI